jgi:hypothetical protein
MIHPQTNQPRDNLTHTKCPSKDLSAVTICPCEILTPIRSIQVFFAHPGFEVDSCHM